jgi:hypothetical protein
VAVNTFTLARCGRITLLIWRTRCVPRPRFNMTDEPRLPMTDLHEPVKCGTCTACCRASSGVVLQPPDVLNAYDYIMAPATAELAAKQQRTNPGALLPLEELPDAPADFLQICKQVGARFAVAELSQHDTRAESGRARCVRPIPHRKKDGPSLWVAGAVSRLPAAA